MESKLDVNGCEISCSVENELKAIIKLLLKRYCPAKLEITDQELKENINDTEKILVNVDYENRKRTYEVIKL